MLHRAGSEVQSSQAGEGYQILSVRSIQEVELPLQGFRVKEVGKKREQYGYGRKCKDKWCDKILTTYNPGPYCYSHAPFRQVRVRGRWVDD